MTRNFTYRCLDTESFYAPIAQKKVSCTEAFTQRCLNAPKNHTQILVGTGASMQRKTIHKSYCKEKSPAQESFYAHAGAGALTHRSFFRRLAGVSWKKGSSRTSSAETYKCTSVLDAWRGVAWDRFAKCAVTNRAFNLPPL